MAWYNSFSTTELFFIGFFLIAYILYITRMIRISKYLKTSFKAVVGKIVLRTVYFLLFIIALLGPLMGNATREVQAVGKDIYLCIDLSQSMNASDVQPSRLEKIKFELKDIIKSFSADRIGLIIFSSEAFVQCPLTYDQNALNLFVETLSTSLVPNTGTDFGPPLRLAYEKFTEDESAPSQQKSKIITLISDGEDFGTETSQVGDKIEESGIRLFTLGIGTEKGSEILSRGAPKTDNQGEVVVTKLNPASLKRLASETGGEYFEINDKRDDTKRLISAIDNIEGELKDSRQIDTSSNKYMYFLAIGTLLFLADQLIKFKTVSI